MAARLKLSAEHRQQTPNLQGCSKTDLDLRHPNLGIGVQLQHYNYPESPKWHSKKPG